MSKRVCQVSKYDLTPHYHQGFYTLGNMNKSVGWIQLHDQNSCEFIYLANAVVNKNMVIKVR